MITLKEFTTLMNAGTVLLIDDRRKVGAVAKTTAGAAWFELATTGNDLKVDYVTPKKGALLVTVSGVHDD